MLIEKFLNVFIYILLKFIELFQIPSFEDLGIAEMLYGTVDQALLLLDDAKSIVNFFIPYDIISMMFQITIIWVSFKFAYKFMIFIIHKIPFINIE